MLEPGRYALLELPQADLAISGGRGRRAVASGTWGGDRRFRQRRLLRDLEYLVVVSEAAILLAMIPAGMVGWLWLGRRAEDKALAALAGRAYNIQRGPNPGATCQHLYLPVK